MCGRVNVYDHTGIQELLNQVGVEVWPGAEPRYNIAPTENLDVVSSEGQTMHHCSMRWGVIPKWARPGQFKSPLFNARAETIHDKPSFKNLVKNQRILLPVNGFYEWHREGGEKTAYYIEPDDHQAMFIGGIYQHVGDGGFECCLITIDANPSMAKIHHRMPVIIGAKDAGIWLGKSDVLEIDALMRPAPNDILKITRVSDYVNNARHKGAECMHAV